MHDPAKVGICQKYLLNGQCRLGLNCDLSHQSTPERVPTCVHFLHGRCSKADCRYAHVHIDQSIQTICRAFAILGFCSRGAFCKERHAFECPDHAATGSCTVKKCRLRHVDRAGQIRQQAFTRSSCESIPDAEDNSDLSSDREGNDDSDGGDVDSEGLADDVEVLPRGENIDQRLSEQQDFVHF